MMCWRNPRSAIRPGAGWVDIEKMDLPMTDFLREAKLEMPKLGRSAKTMLQ
jgi:hypothetical protein